MAIIPRIATSAVLRKPKVFQKTLSHCNTCSLLCSLYRCVLLTGCCFAGIMDPDTVVSYEETVKIAEIIQDRTNSKYRPSLGLILGSGYAIFEDHVKDSTAIPFSDIPHFPSSKVAGHKGRFMLGYVGNKCVAIMQGRFHPYEGHSLQHAALPVRVMKLLGVETLLLTNAAGGINPEYRIGDFMIIKDHIFFPEFSGRHPLAGENDDRWGPRFPSMTRTYDKSLRQLAVKVFNEMGEDVHEGVYGMNGGPSFETPAEVKMLKILGCDVIGMSTCHEAITAIHCGLRVFGMSMVTNECISDVDSTTEGPCHQEVLDTADRRIPTASLILSKFIERI